MNSVTVKFRIIMLATVAILVASCLTAGAIYSLQSIGHKLMEIAEEDIPLTNNVTGITIHQLEQAVNFERALH